VKNSALQRESARRLHFRHGEAPSRNGKSASPDLTITWSKTKAATKGSAQ